MTARMNHKPKPVTCLFAFDMRRHREFLARRDHIEQRRTIVVEDLP
jgi:hypothetical protein